MGNKGMRGDRKAKKVTSDQGPLGPIREKFMKYIAEILSDDIVWLINKKRRLISIHQTRKEAGYYCQKHYNMVPVVIDRRPDAKNRNSW